MRFLKLSIIIFCFIVSGCSKKQPDQSGGVVVVNPDSVYTTGSTPLQINIPANESYPEPWADNNLGINLVQQSDSAVVDQWTSARDVAWYLYMSPGTYKYYLNASVSLGDSSNFSFIRQSADSTLNSTFAPKAVQFGIKGTGSISKIYIDSVIIPYAGFYKFGLQPNYKSGSSYASIKNLSFSSSSANPGVRFAKYLSSPSVHLAFSPTDGLARQYDWLYGEINVPKGYDPEYTFYMCIGVDMGYFGMQVNSAAERRILFSIWNSYASDSSSSVPDSLKVVLLDNGTNVQSEPFNNEGSGSHAYLVYPWQTETTVKFIMNARRMPDNSVVYSGWFMDNTSTGWQYMASYKSPSNNAVFNGFYSFLENFGTGTGQQIRKGYYSNMWGRVAGSDSSWISFSKAAMTYTDGASNSRSDYAGGVDVNNSSRFYMQSGGYLGPVFNPTSSVPAGTVPPITDLTALNARIDQALKNTVTSLSKINWKIFGFDSQETTGEPAPSGFATAAIDNDTTTYWHTAWSASQPGYPHYLSIDMAQTQSISGLLFNSRADKSNGRPQNITLFTSADGSNWVSQGDYVLLNTASLQTIRFGNPVSCRYFKVNITSGYDDGTENVFFTHLAEIGAFQ